jgi:hypothetical protein
MGFRPRLVNLAHRRAAAERWEFVDLVTCGLEHNLPPSAMEGCRGIPDVCQPKCLSLAFVSSPFPSSYQGAMGSFAAGKRHTIATFMEPLDVNQQFITASCERVREFFKSLWVLDDCGKRAEPFANVKVLGSAAADDARVQRSWAGFKLELAGLRRLQWCWVRFDKECVPVRVLRIELRWLVASGPSMDEVCTWLSRRAKQSGLVEIPSTTGSPLFNAELQSNAAGSSLQPDPFLNIINFKLPSTLVRRLLLLRFITATQLPNHDSSQLNQNSHAASILKSDLMHYRSLRSHLGFVIDCMFDGSASACSSSSSSTIGFSGPKAGSRAHTAGISDVKQTCASYDPLCPLNCAFLTIVHAAM